MLLTKPSQFPCREQLVVCTMQGT